MTSVVLRSWGSTKVWVLLPNQIKITPNSRRAHTKFCGSSVHYLKLLMDFFFAPNDLRSLTPPALPPATHTASLLGLGWLHSRPADLHGLSIFTTLGSMATETTFIVPHREWLCHTMSALRSSPWPPKSCIFYAFRTSTMWIALTSTSSAAPLKCNLPLLDHSCTRIWVLTWGDASILPHWSLELHFSGVDFSDSHSCVFSPSPISTQRFSAKNATQNDPSAFLIKSLIFSKAPVCWFSIVYNSYRIFTFQAPTEMSHPSISSIQWLF